MPRKEHRRIAEAYIDAADHDDWVDVNPYILAALPNHALLAGELGELLDRQGALDNLDQDELSRALVQASFDNPRLMAESQGVIAGVHRLSKVDPGHRAILRKQAKLLRGFSAGTGPQLPTVTGLLGWRDAPHAIAGMHAASLTGVSLLELPGDGGVVAVSCDRAGTARVWDASTGREFAVLESHAGPVSGVSTVVTAGGRALGATSSEDGTAKVWDLVDGALIFTYEAHAASLTGVSLLELPGDGGVVAATCSEDKSMHVWFPLDAEKSSLRLTGHSHFLTDVDACVFGGELVCATSSEDNSVRIWHPLSSGDSGVLAGHTLYSTSVSLIQLSDGRRICASASQDLTVRIWNSESAEPLTAHEGHTSQVLGIAGLSIPEPVVVTAGADGRIYSWDLSSESSRLHIDAYQHWVLGVDVARTSGSLGPVCISCTSSRGGGTADIWALGDGRHLNAFTLHSGDVLDVALIHKAEGTLVAASVDSNGICFAWEPLGGAVLGRFQTDGTELRRVKLVERANGDVFVVASGDQVTYVWSVESGRHVTTFSREGMLVTSLGVEISKADEIVCLVGGARGKGEGVAYIWNGDTGKELSELNIAGAWITAVTFLDSEARSCVTASQDMAVRIWSVQTAQETDSFPLIGPPTSLSVLGRQILVGIANKLLVFRPRDPLEPALIVEAVSDL